MSLINNTLARSQEEIRDLTRQKAEKLSSAIVTGHQPFSLGADTLIRPLLEKPKKRSPGRLKTRIPIDKSKYKILCDDVRKTLFKDLDLGMASFKNDWILLIIVSIGLQSARELSEKYGISSSSIYRINKDRRMPEKRGGFVYCKLGPEQSQYLAQKLCENPCIKGKDLPASLVQRDRHIDSFKSYQFRDFRSFSKSAESHDAPTRCYYIRLRKTS